MDIIEKVGLAANLYNEYCAFKHGPDTKVEDYPAVDYLVQPMGYTDGSDKGEDLSHITIPICQECADGLLDNQWVLMYCLDCHSNQWLSRLKAKLQYGLYDIIWLKGCPKCSEKPNAVYFD